MAAIDPIMAGVSAPRKVAHVSCTPNDMPPVQMARVMFFIHAFLSVSIRITNGTRMNSGASWMIAKADTSGSIAAIAAIIIYDRLFIRKRDKSRPASNFSAGETLKAWSVYLFILALILISGALCPPVNNFLKGHLVSAIPLPIIGSTFKFGWISNAALMLFIGSVVGGLIQGLTVRQLTVVMARTLVNLRFTALTIICLISLASIMNYSGMIAAIAAGLVAISGSFYPLFAPLIGAIGTFVTGSDTSANILFGKLQANVAHQLGMNGQLSVTGFSGSQADWLAAANTAGATGGKMISPQSIAIATAACDMKGADDAILRKAIPYAACYILICGLIVYLSLC